jgi:hypothetical protein
VVAHMTPSQAWKKISAAFDSATKDKAVAFANRTITVTHLRAKAETYRQNGAKILEKRQPQLAASSAAGKGTKPG